MSSLTYTEKKLLEQVFEMEEGHLLDFSHSSLRVFMDDFKIDLGDNKYDKYGSSKAKRMRAFWEVEDDAIVVPVIKGLLEDANNNDKVTVPDNEKAQKVINRLEGNEEHRNEVEGFASAEEKIINHAIWGNGKVRVFLSHKSEFMKETATLKEELAFYGVSCFVAHKDIEPTKLWQDEIEKALHSMDILVALMTDGFQDSNWTDQEIGFAIGRKKPIISVRMGTDPYGFIGKYQGVASNWDDAPLKIMKILMSEEKMLDAYIEELRFCPSYDEANRFAKCLPYIGASTKEQIQKLIGVYAENGQIHGSRGFNGRTPDEHGKGLVFHLSRVTGKDYKIANNHKIVRS